MSAPTQQETGKPTRRIPQFTWGDRIARVRKDLGMDQKEFAELIGYPRGTIGGWEASGSLPRDIVTAARRIEAKTGVPFEWLIGVWSGGPSALNSCLSRTRLGFTMPGQGKRGFGRYGVDRSIIVRPLDNRPGSKPLVDVAA